MLTKRWLWMVTLGAGFLLTGAYAPAAQANSCDELRRQEIHLQRDIYLFGPNSYQANIRRAIVDRYRQECGYYGGGYYGNPYYNGGYYGRGDGDRDDWRWRRRGDGDRDDRWRGGDRDDRWRGGDRDRDRDGNRGNGWMRGNGGDRGHGHDRDRDRDHDGDRHRH